MRCSPGLIENLMANPRGVIFRFANYDIVDEVGRVFPFTAQEVNDKTGSVVIDYGGFDTDNDGVGRHRRDQAGGHRASAARSSTPTVTATSTTTTETSSSTPTASRWASASATP